ncbi:MAG: FAD-binding protein [Pseudomonadales bacterium]|nr:FAD-binding protein [Pseudomonadales bacterium]NRA17138.1 electron transfer flavoprotein subunit alpha/FixB family protein [Oceanospirillaceae bacterium]
MRPLVIAEHQQQTLDAATLSTVTAAQQIGGKVDLLICGENISSVVDQAAKIEGIYQLLVADHVCYKDQLAENTSKLLLTLSENYTHIFAAATTQGKNLLPRLAALLDVPQLSEIIQIIDANTFVRPIYAGNALATVQLEEATILATVRSTAFDAVPFCDDQAVIVYLDDVHENDLSRFIAEDLSQSDRPELGAARIVVSGGRGMGSGDNFSLLNNVADKLGAAVGASRAAVDAGFAANDMQVGQTGKIVAPELYIAVGISGAIQHLAGMKDSKVIVAINQDADAPIFQVADYGLVSDLFESLPQLEQLL